MGSRARQRIDLLHGSGNWPTHGLTPAGPLTWPNGIRPDNFSSLLVDFSCPRTLKAPANVLAYLSRAGHSRCHWAQLKP